MTLWLLLVAISCVAPISNGWAAGGKAGSIGILIGLLVGLPVGIGNAWGIWTAGRSMFRSTRLTKESTIAFIYIAVFVWSFVSGFLVDCITRSVIRHVA